MKKLLVGVLTLLTCTLIGCGGTENVQEKEKEKEVVNETKEDVLTIGAGRTFWYGSTKIDYMHKTTNVWESLFTLDENMNPIPDLAEGIKQSEDGLKWTIKLKEGVKFHDGTELNAETAKNNLLRVYHFSTKDQKCTKEYKNKVALGDIKSIDVLDDYTLEVNHNKIVPNFDEKLGYSKGMMFSMASFNEDGQIVEPIGTGAYAFESYDEQNMILTLESFDDYRDGEADVETVIFKSIPDADTRLSTLRSGEIDVIADVGSILPTQAQIIESDANLVLEQQPVATNHYLLMNMHEGKLLNNKEIREGINLILDRKLIVDTILEGYGKVADSVVTNNATKFYKEMNYEYNPEKGKELIQKNLNGKEENLKIILSSSLIGRWPYKDVMVLLQGEFKKVGINAEIEIVDSPTWQEKMTNGDYDITISPYTCDTAEPLDFFDAHMKTDGRLNIGRSYGYKNEKINELLEKVSVEMDLEKRITYYEELQTIAKEDYSIIPVWHDSALFATNKKVKNFTLDLNFWPDLHKVSIEE